MAQSKITGESIRAALALAREQRAQLVASDPFPMDSAHLVERCDACGRVGLGVLGFFNGPYEGPPGFPRYRTGDELKLFLSEMFGP